MGFPETENACVHNLQQLVAGKARELISIIHRKTKQSKKNDPFVQSLYENGLTGKKGNALEDTLENECSIAALVLLLHHTAQHFSAPGSKFEQEAFKNLPQNFRNFLVIINDEVSDLISPQDCEAMKKILVFPADITGNVYNTFLYNDHQQSHGQHFTQTNETDILNAFCIDVKTKTIFDCSCGSGIFLKRAYYFLDHVHKPKGKKKFNLTGVDVSPFATYLAAANFLFIKDQPVLFTEDFLNIGDPIKHDSLKNMDACIGNPPYIRHEKQKEKQSWKQLIQKNYGISYISAQSDLYIYFLVHAISFLKEGGRLGWVIASSWLDSRFGKGLQQFLLTHCKIICVIDQQSKRSFQTASVNTVLLVIEKCSNEQERKNNKVKFVRLFNEYEKWIGDTTSPSRIEDAIAFAKKTEDTRISFSEEDMQVTIIQQEILWEHSYNGGKFENGYWGAAYLRSPAILQKIMKSKDKLIPLSGLVDVKYGVKTGANDFFYLADETSKAKAMDEKTYRKVFGEEKKKHMKIWDHCGWYLSGLNNEHFIIEKEFVIPVFKTQKEAQYLDVALSKLKFGALDCPLPLQKLEKEKKKVAEYIRLAEGSWSIHERPSVKGRKPWYRLSAVFVKGDFIFPSKIGEKYRLIDNRTTRVVCDKVNYVIQIKKEWINYADEIFLLMNSIFFRHMVDLFSRQLTGSQTLSDVDVIVLKNTLVPSPDLFRKECNDVKELLHSLKSRDQYALSKEIMQEDKLQIDRAIGRVLKLTNEDINLMYRDAADFVEKRQMKSGSAG